MEVLITTNKKMLTARASAFSILFLLQFFYLGCSEHTGQPVKVAGSTTLEPFISQAFDIYNSKKKLNIQVRPTGSRAGIQELLDGQCDIAMSSVKITAEELESTSRIGVKIKSFLLDYDSIVPIVHPQNPVRQITTLQLNNIFSGDINNWKYLGGEDKEIMVVVRDSSSGTYGVWSRMITNPQTNEKHTVIQHSNSGVLSYVANHLWAIGYISSIFINPEVRLLVLESGSVKKHSALGNNNPLRRGLYLYVTEDNFTGPVKNFITFLLANPQSKALFENLGYLKAQVIFQIPNKSIHNLLQD